MASDLRFVKYVPDQIGARPLLLIEDQTEDRPLRTEIIRMTGANCRYCARRRGHTQRADEAIPCSALAQKARPARQGWVSRFDQRSASAVRQKNQRPDQSNGVLDLIFRRHEKPEHVCAISFFALPACRMVIQMQQRDRQTSEGGRQDEPGPLVSRVPRTERAAESAFWLFRSQ